MLIKHLFLLSLLLMISCVPKDAWIIGNYSKLPDKQLPKGAYAISYSGEVHLTEFFRSFEKAYGNNDNLYNSVVFGIKTYLDTSNKQDNIILGKGKAEFPKSNTTYDYLLYINDVTVGENTYSNTSYHQGTPTPTGATVGGGWTTTTSSSCTIGIRVEVIDKQNNVILEFGVSESETVHLFMYEKALRNCVEKAALLVAEVMSNKVKLQQKSEY